MKVSIELPAAHLLTSTIFFRPHTPKEREGKETHCH